MSSTVTPFSATGSIFQKEFALKAINAERKEPIFEVAFLNRKGYMPIISSFTGPIRVLLATVHAVVHLAAVVFDFKNGFYHLHQVGIGMANILRGLVETVPFVGNAIMIAVDLGRLKYAIHKEAKQGHCPDFPCSDIVNGMIDDEIEYSEQEKQVPEIHLL